MASRDAPTTAATLPALHGEEGDDIGEEEGGVEPPPAAKQGSSIKTKVSRWRRKRAPVDAADRTRLVDDEGGESPRGGDAVGTLSSQWVDDLDGSAQRDGGSGDDEYDDGDDDPSGEATRAPKPEQRIYEL